MRVIRTFVILSILWCLIAGGYGWSHPPTLPLDLNIQDPATAAAYAAAVRRSHLVWGVIAFAPLLVVLLISIFVKRFKTSS